MVSLSGMVSLPSVTFPFSSFKKAIIDSVATRSESKLKSRAGSDWPITGIVRMSADSTPTNTAIDLMVLAV